MSISIQAYLPKYQNIPLRSVCVYVCQNLITGFLDNSGNVRHLCAFRVVMFISLGQISAMLSDPMSLLKPQLEDDRVLLNNQASASSMAYIIKAVSFKMIL